MASWPIARAPVKRGLYSHLSTRTTLPAINIWEGGNSKTFVNREVFVQHNSSVTFTSSIPLPARKSLSLWIDIVKFFGKAVSISLFSITLVWSFPWYDYVLVTQSLWYKATSLVKVIPFTTISSLSLWKRHFLGKSISFVKLSRARYTSLVRLSQCYGFLVTNFTITIFFCTTVSSKSSSIKHF